MKSAIVVAGNIGTGKTTLALRLSEALRWNVEHEPVSDNPYLSDFYHDMSSWAYHLQLHFLARRTTQHRNASLSPNSIIIDRSLYEDGEVFAPVLRTAALISERDYATYQLLYDIALKSIKTPDLILYLSAEPITLLRRVRNRGRPFESELSLNYLIDLNNQYEKWIANFVFCPVLKISTERLNPNDPANIRALIDEIGKALHLAGAKPDALKQLVNTP